MKEQYICQLSEAKQLKVKSAIIDYLSCELGYVSDEDIENAMDSKIVDLPQEIQDTIIDEH